MFLLVVLFILPRTVVYGRSYEHSIDKKIDIDAFNCPKQCGKMAKQDESYQDVCTAYKNGGNCPEEEGEDYNGGEEHNRIVGGEEVQYHIPWLVLLAITAYDDRAQIMCGGSLINDRFILTAAHCPCMEYVGLCTRSIGKVEKTPIKIKDDVKPKQSVLAYVGVAQQKEQTPMKLLGQKSKSEEVEKLFIHPDLSTTEEFSTTPDILLVKIKPIQKFTEKIGPICLAHGDVQDVPPCSDDSIDVMETEISKIKQFGGCATVAGWGNRYDIEKKVCVTDNSFSAPAKHRPCHETKDKCSTENIKSKQMSRNCKNLKHEMAYQVQQGNIKYKALQYEQLAQKAPIIILAGKKKKKYVCGKTNFANERNDPKWNGWCATKLDRKDKIKEYGFCTAKCQDEKTTVQKLNVNLLSDAECETLTEEGDRLDSKREMCAGKKTFFPDFTMRVLKRQKKSKNTKEREKHESEDKKLKPTKYSYKYMASTSKNTKEHSKLINMRAEMKVLRNISEEYQYKWFLGGKDACQGDSGGPLWRTMDVGKEKRAVLIGVIARGRGCADFNKPGIFSKVKANYDFIKQIVGKESKDACPKSPGGYK